VIEIETSGSFKHLEKFLKSKSYKFPKQILEEYAKEGVLALSLATPIESNLTASSWSYEILNDEKSFSIVWKNSNTTTDGTPVAILLQYGHATGTGGYVQGLDFINPAIQPIFDKIANDVWREVTAK
jgi:glucose dehydrogenase